MGNENWNFGAKTSLFLFLLYSIIINAQNKIDFFPSGLNFLPLKANIQEARLGVLYFPDNKNLKVDVGNSVDLIKFYFRDENTTAASGIEFMGYALSTNYRESRLQIDALDGFFGGNITVKKKYLSNELDLRFRIIHNSAHLVDGHYNFSEDKWIDNTQAIHYTRNFYELTAANQLRTSFGFLKYYGAFSHAFFVRPAKIKRVNLYGGFELAFRNLLGPILRKDENIFITSCIYVGGLDEYVVSQQTIIGIKIGTWDGKGLTFYSSYYTGLNYFDAYYGERISKFGVGFNVDFL